MRKWLRKVFGIPEDIETRIGILVEENRKLRARVEALERFLEPVKGYIKSTPMREDIERKKRMLRGIRINRRKRGMSNGRIRSRKKGIGRNRGL